LDLAVNRTLKRDRWCALASEIGAPLRECDRLPGDIDGMLDFVRSAKGLMLPHECFLLAPQLVDAITECVAAGRPLLVKVNPNSLDRLNPFLGRYGLEGTLLAVHDEAAKSHSRLIELKRQQSPGAFHPHPLLDGVNRLVIQQANALRYSGSAIPILALPLERLLIVDLATDFPAEWTSPELSCLVLSPVAQNGGVLALSCGFIHDPYVGPTGIDFPGITVADNEVLALNILNWLAGHRLEPSGAAATAFDLVDRIERSLVEFAVNGLKSAFEDWWTNGIPLPIRNKCAQRREEEGNKIPKVAYLDLLDVREILEKNWRLFEKKLAAVGWGGGKKSPLSWFDELNDIRRSVMHPVRRHFVPNLVGQTTLSKLSDLLNRIQRLGVGSAMVH